MPQMRSLQMYKDAGHDGGACWLLGRAIESSPDQESPLGAAPPKKIGAEVTIVTVFKW